MSQVEPSVAPMRVKETFNIFKDGRAHNPAPQSFQLDALKALANAGETKERIKLGEAIGYWGHRIRELTGKIKPTEFEVIMVDGKPVPIQVEPLLRTVSFEVDDSGNVTHEQEFANTELGRKAYALYMQGFGGFSWAMSGRDGRGSSASIATMLAGFDYVDQPNFIPLSRQGMLLSSMKLGGDKLLSSLNDVTSQTDAAALVSMLSKSPESDAVAFNDLIVSSLIQKESARQDRLSAALDKLPFLLTDDQKAAFVRQEEGDVKTIVQLLSSMQSTDLNQFPHNQAALTVPARKEKGMDDLVRMTTGLNWR